MNNLSASRWASASARTSSFHHTDDNNKKTKSSCSGENTVNTTAAGPVPDMNTRPATAAITPPQRVQGVVNPITSSHDVPITGLSLPRAQGQVPAPAPAPAPALVTDPAPPLAPPRLTLGQKHQQSQLQDFDKFLKLHRRLKWRSTLLLFCHQRALNQETSNVINGVDFELDTLTSSSSHPCPYPYHPRPTSSTPVNDGSTSQSASGASPSTPQKRSANPAEIMFKIDFFEFYVLLERVLVHLLGVFGMVIRAEYGDTTTAVPLPPSLQPTSAVDSSSSQPQSQSQAKTTSKPRQTLRSSRYAPFHDNYNDTPSSQTTRPSSTSISNLAGKGDVNANGSDSKIKDGIVGDSRTFHGYSHRFHANVLSALDLKNNPLHPVLGQGKVREYLALAKEFRNRWKDVETLSSSSIQPAKKATWSRSLAESRYARNGAGGGDKRSGGSGGGVIENGNKKPSHEGKDEEEEEEDLIGLHERYRILLRDLHLEELLSTILSALDQAREVAEDRVASIHRLQQLAAEVEREKGRKRETQRTTISSGIRPERTDGDGDGDRGSDIEMEIDMDADVDADVDGVRCWDGHDPYTRQHEQTYGKDGSVVSVNAPVEALNNYNYNYNYSYRHGHANRYGQTYVDGGDDGDDDDDDDDDDATMDWD